MNFKPCALVAAALLGYAHAALGADGEVAVRVDLNPAHSVFNRPRVTVSVCLQQPGPDGKGCIEVPDVLVDTGSTGLLLRRSALTGLAGLKPAGEYDHAFRHRYVYAPAFGALTQAWIGLGTLYTPAPIGIGLFGADDEPASPGSSSGGGGEVEGLAMLLQPFNGVLGIAPQPSSCSACPDCACPPAAEVAQYFRRMPAGGGDAWQPSPVPSGYELSNPVAALPADFNDGFVLRIELPDSAALQAGVTSGTLFLGVERWRDKLFGERAPRVPLVNASWLRAAIMREPGKLVQACIGLDTGCCEIYAPKAYEPLPAHAGPGPIWQLPMFCVGSVDKREFRYGPFMIDVADGESAAIEVCQLHRLAASFSDDDLFLLGMPFFYGRTIAFGLAEDPRAVSGRDPDGGYLMIAPAPPGA